jgi:hypothetical protein
LKGSNLMKKYTIVFWVLILLLIFYEGYQLSMAKESKLKLFDLDKSNYAMLSSRNGSFNYLINGENHEIKFGINDNWASNFVQSIFLINKNLACLALGEHIIYYDFNKNSVIKDLKIGTNINTMAINKNTAGDLIVFSAGSLYNYDFGKDKLTKLKDLISKDEDDSINYPSLYIHPNKIAYSKIRNSVFYSAYIDPVKKNDGIFELSLNDYSVTLRGIGFMMDPHVKTNILRI